MKTKSILSGILIICLLGLASVSWGDEYISIMTGSTAGVYYPLGGGISRIWNKYVPNVNATVEVSGGSVVNLRLIQQGQANAALVQNDAAYFASKGSEPFKKGEIITKHKGILMLYDEHFHIATTKQSGINSMTDLRGKKIRIGFPGSIVTVSVLALLEAYGMTEKDIKPHYISLPDGVEQIKDGNLDVLIEIIGAPSSGFLDLAHTRDIVFLSIDKEHREKLIRKYPFFSDAVIPAGTYKGLKEDLPVLAVTCMLVASSDLSTELVYNLTKAVFEHLDILGESHAKGKLIKLDTALKGMSIPLHPGAEKYYKEIGKIK